MFDFLVIFGVPFAISAAIHYLSLWVSLPLVFLLALLWIGCLASLGERR